MAKIAIGIVMFNPHEIDRVKQCIESASNQSEKIYIFDNSTRKIEVSFPKNVEYMSDGENKGIAYALNRIMEKAMVEDFEWVVTMDQDSILPEGMIADFSSYCDSEKKLGIVSPQVVDKRRSYMEIKKEPMREYVEECITSASCTSLEAWRAVGGFDEWLFIDLVDNEFCKRLQIADYKILRLNQWVLDQEFGKIIPKSKKTQDFWKTIAKILKNENFAKFSYKKFVSPMRVYYTNRNIIYVNRKLKDYGPVAYNNYHCKGYFGFLICFALPSFLRAQEKGKVLKAILQGRRDGLKKKVDVWKI